MMRCYEFSPWFEGCWDGFGRTFEFLWLFWWTYAVIGKFCGLALLSLPIGSLLLPLFFLCCHRSAALSSVSFQYYKHNTSFSADIKSSLSSSIRALNFFTSCSYWSALRVEWLSSVEVSCNCFFCLLYETRNSEYSYKSHKTWSSKRKVITKLSCQLFQII